MHLPGDRGGEGTSFRRKGLESEFSKPISSYPSINAIPRLEGTNSSVPPPPPPPPAAAPPRPRPRPRPRPAGASSLKGAAAARPFGRVKTYSLSLILVMWSAIVASVPIPLTSISPMSSGSVRYPGAAVFPSVIFASAGTNVSPTSKCGSRWEDSHLSYGYTSR